MTIDDLSNDLLRFILCRILCYRTTLRYKSVSKRWCSIISDPLFANQGFLYHPEIDEKEPHFAFLFTMKSLDKHFVTATVAPQRSLCSPIMSLQFLPRNSIRFAAFKDLILSFGVHQLTGLSVFYICNPLTMQWMVLPPSPSQQKPVIWATLLRMKGRGFRVVAAHSEPKNYSSVVPPFIIINLFVYVSETCQWRSIDVRVNSQPTGGHIGEYYRGVVCKSMVCIYYRSYFGAFNPFDVADTLEGAGTLTATDLPLPGGYVDILFESDGKLVALRHPYITLWSHSKGAKATNLSKGSRIWKLDMKLNNNKLLSRWKSISRLDDGHINVKGSVLTPPDHFSYYGHTFLEVVGVHPSKEHLVYLLRKYGGMTQNRLILYDTKSKTIEPLTTTIPSYEQSITSFHRLDIPCWPTPIPIP